MSWSKLTNSAPVTKNDHPKCERNLLKTDDPELPMNPCRRIKPLEETIDPKKDLYFFQEKDLYFLIKNPLFFKGT